MARLALVVVIVAATGGCGSATQAPSSTAPTPTAPEIRPDAAAAGLDLHRGTPADPTARWSAAFAGPSHPGVAASVGPQTSRLRWHRDLEGSVTAGPVVGPDGTILAASNGGVLHALDPLTGRDRWTFDGGGSYGSDLSTSPAVVGGVVIWPGPRDRLFGVDGATGRQRWSVELGAQPLSPAVLSPTTVVVATMDGTVAAIDVSAAAATVRWTLAIGEGVSYGSPAVAADGTIYGTVGDQLVAVRDDGDHGTVRWRVTVGADIEVSPSVGPDGTVVVGTNDPFQWGVRPDGTVSWRYRRDAWSYSSSISTPGGLSYFGDHRGFVTVVDTATGAVRTRYQGGEEVWTAPAVDARGDVYFGTRGGHIVGFAADGRPLVDVTTGGIVDSYPALTPTGDLVVGSSDGTLYDVAGGG